MIENFLRIFWAHLEELRNRLMRVAVCFIICFLICFNYIDRLVPYLIKPAGKLIFNSPADAFGIYVTLSIVAATIISSPYILFHLWSFVGKALHEREQRFIMVFGPLSLVFFLSGVAFAYWVAVPMSYKFLMTFSSDYLIPMVTVDKYFDFMGQLMLAFGLTFELPLIMAFFASIGLATPEFLRQKRRHAILIIVIVAAILTPPDVASQVILALPLIVLYELGIIFVKFAYKGKEY